MTDLVGRKVRLTGAGWDEDNGYPRRNAIRTITHQGGGGYWWADGGALSVLNADGACAYRDFAAELLPPRERFLIYMAETVDEGGTSTWSPVDRDPGGEAFVWSQFKGDQKFGHWEHGILVEMYVAGYAPDDAARERIDMFFDYLGEDILAGRVGKIIDRY